MEIAEAVGRILLSLVFLRGGFQAVRHPGGRTRKAAKLKLPSPEIMVRINGGVMVVGGAALATGIYVPVAATLLLASLVPTTLAGHMWWIEGDERVRNAQFTHFLKNTAMGGGLLFVIAATV